MKSFAYLLAVSPVLVTAAAKHGEDDDHVSHGSSATFTTPDTPIPTPTLPDGGGCPTVTETGVLCPTCAVPACLVLSTVSDKCGCPAAVPTETIDFPCESKCRNIGCSTSYTYVTGTVTDFCPTPTDTVTPSPPSDTDPPTYTATDTDTYEPTGPDYPSDTTETVTPSDTGVPKPTDSSTKNPQVTDSGAGRTGGSVVGAIIMGALGFL